MVYSRRHLSVVFLVVVIAFTVHPQSELITVRTPDLAGLEEGVREQVTAAQNALAAAAKGSESALSEAYGKLGQVYHAYSLIEPARDCYLNASLLAPKDFRWTYLVAKLDHQEGRFEEAIRRYRIARTLRPDYVAVDVNLGNILLELNRSNEAGESFNAALALDKNNPAAHYGLGQIALSTRNYAEAIRHFEATLAAAPSANRVHYSLAMAYRGLGEVDQAKAQIAKGGSVGVRVVDPLVDDLQELVAGERLPLARGKVAFEAKRYAEAAAEFRKAVAFRPDSVTARINLGAALTEMGDTSGAIEQFEEALRIDPRRVNAHYNLAFLLSRQNKHEQAIDHLQSALAIEPDDSAIRFQLGKELISARRLNEALTELSRVVQLAPGNEAALLELARLFTRKAQYKEALETLEKGYAQYPQRGRTIVLLAYLLATSPELNLRSGARSLELAQRVYDATRAPQHGVLVALALAELGRCREASDWQQRMIAAAEQQNNAELLAKLRTTLKLTSQTTCRPAIDPSFIDLLLSEK